jgi:hypothetical protein
MPKKDVERLVGRAILDAEFRERLFADPEATVREEGFNLTKKEMAALKEVDAEKAMALASQLEDTPAAAWK